MSCAENSLQRRAKSRLNISSPKKIPGSDMEVIAVAIACRSINARVF
jgi:hypothetical protein